MDHSDDIGLFDLDNSLAGYDVAMERDYDSLKSPSDPPYKSFNDEEYPIYIKNRISMIKKQPGWWKNLPRLEEGIKLFNLSKEIGFRNVILSKGPYKNFQAWAEKVEWVRENLQETDIILSEDKGLIYGKFLYDDYPEYIQAWLADRPRGLVIMPLYEYNKDFFHPNVLRYDGQNLDQVKRALVMVKERRPRERLDLSKI